MLVDGYFCFFNIYVFTYCLDSFPGHTLHSKSEVFHIDITLFTCTCINSASLVPYFCCKLTREKDRKATLVIDMQGPTTIIKNPDAPCELLSAPFTSMYTICTKLLKTVVLFCSCKHHYLKRSMLPVFNNPKIHPIC